MQAAQAMTTRRTPRTPTAPQRANTTSRGAAVAKSPSVVRAKACTSPTRNSCARIQSTILDRLAAMGISREVAEAVLAAIRADAAASGTGKARTARVIAALKAQDIEAHAAAIKILAGSISIETERGPEQGHGTPSGTGGRGGGRPPGIRTLYSPIRARARELAKEGYRAAEIARKLGTTRQNISKLLTDGND